MPYTIKIQPERQMLEILFYGDFSYEDALSAREEASRLVQGRNVRCLLVDQSRIETFPGTTTNMFDFHTSHEGLFPPGLHMALVYSPKTTPPSDARFAETVAVNHGALFGTFTARKEALDWLFEEVF